MKNIKTKLKRIWKLIESGDALERDLALELLREVYAEVKFGKFANKTSATAIDESTPEGKDCQVIAEHSEAEEEVETEESETAETEETENSREAGPETDEDQEPEEQPVIHHLIAPDVIRSLYGGGGDEAHDKAAPASAPSRLPESATLPKPVSESEPIPEPEPALEPTEKAPPTLGDRMTAGHRTLGETLRTGDRDMASKIAAAERSGLKKSIGLNDRFLMIRDLFGGDSEAFEIAITRLDAFTDLDEAVIWLHDNIERGMGSRGAELLVELLERKLG